MRPVSRLRALTANSRPGGTYPSERGTSPCGARQSSSEDTALPAGEANIYRVILEVSIAGAVGPGTRTPPRQGRGSAFRPRSSSPPGLPWTPTTGPAALPGHQSLRIGGKDATSSYVRGLSQGPRTGCAPSAGRTFHG